MSINLSAKFCDSGWSDEYDSVPLRLRLKMLRARGGKPDYAEAAVSVPDSKCESTSQNISVNHEEDVNLNAEMMLIENRTSTVILTSDSSKRRASYSGSNFLSLAQNASAPSAGPLGEFDLDITSGKSCIYSSTMPAPEARANVVEKQEPNNEIGAFSHPKCSDLPGDVKIPSLDSLADSVVGSNIKHEIMYEFDDNLDNVVLGVRRRMLLSRKLMQNSESCMEERDSYGGLSNFSKVVLQSASIEVQESDSVRDMLISNNRNLAVDAYDNLVSKSATDVISHTINKHSPPLSDGLYDAVSIEPRAAPSFEEFECFARQEITATSADAMSSSFFPLLARVKDEHVDTNDLCHEGRTDMQNITSEITPVKSEPGFPEFLGDKLDHLPLVDRAKLLSSGSPGLNISQNPEFFNENVAATLDVGNDVLDSVKPISIVRCEKRRRTATNSVETALEEDAPGLLKVLIERGVSVEEIKLYGEEESEDTLDDSLTEDGFVELEAVIAQLFSQRQSFLKFPLLRCLKGAKARYCLSCLLSLVEQTRYLRNRKWPVEWGWCRDLQSFIFVFPRHNRIVLERPEYGYATYFFELLNYVPIDWQIKRLVTAMKLTSCGRITLIENKPLLVGEDLSEGEARVLAEYGWIPNTGLGTMLNYCDRVVHDRKQEMDSSEWRSKIARQLMNGYNGGNIVSKTLPKKLLEPQDSEIVRVKLEE